MADLRIVDAPLLSTVKGTEKIPTGGEGNFSVSVNQVADFAKLKWVLATEGYVNNAVGNVQADLNLHKNNESNPHNVTKTQVGLGNVDNTADLDKPVSNATQASIISAVAQKADKNFVDAQLALKASKADVYTKPETYTKQESTDLVNSSISIALTPVNASLDLAKRGIVNRYDSSLTYNTNERVVLTNGDIVKSTVDGNTNDPNVVMTGWVKTNSASQIFDESGIDLQSNLNNTSFFIRSNDTDVNIFKACTPAKIAAIKNGTLTDITSELLNILSDDTGRTIRLIKGNYALEDTINITKRNVKIVGDVGDRFSANGTMIQSQFNGALFKLGNDVPLANWDDELYNGIQGFTLKNLNISQGVRDAFLLGQTLEKYGSNSFAIQDWCGGHLDIEGVWFEGFYRAVFGLQSDFSTFKRIRASYNKQAIVMANRSDQITIDDYYSFYNDNALTTASTYLNLSKYYSVNDGSVSTVPIEVLCGASSIVIDHPWFETLAGEAYKREAYIRAGVNAGFTGIANAVDGLSVINNPLVYTKPQAETNTTKSLIDVGKVISLEVDESSTKSGQSSNLAQLVNVVGDSSITASTTRGTINIKRTSNIASLFKNSSSGTPSISVCGDLSGAHLIATPSGRQHLRKLGGNATSDLFISGEDSDGGLFINAPNTTAGQKNRLVIRKSYQQLAAIPTTGTWNIGDYVQNQNPVILGTVGSKYIVQGWSRITNGSSHVLNTDWVECRALTGT